MVEWSSGFKEVITAILTFIIVLSAIFLLLSSLYPVFNLDQAKGVLTIFGGWVGLAIGYYFGRVPAEKAADKANEVAEDARNKMEKAVADRASALTLLEDQRNQLQAMKLRGETDIQPMIDSINNKFAALRQGT